MGEGNRCFENPYRQSINISSLARLGTACEANGTQTQGKGNSPRSPSLDCCSDARCQVGWTKAMMPGTIDCLVEGLLMCDVASSDV